VGKAVYKLFSVCSPIVAERSLLIYQMLLFGF